MKEGLKSESRETIGLKGVYRLTRAFLEKKEHFELNDLIVAERSAGRPFRHLVDKLNSMCRVEVLVLENLIPTVGRAAIANALTDSTPSPSSLLITHMALGTGTNAPANGDTTLQTETYRNAIASLTNSQATAYATGFFSATETTGTYREVGLFIAGSSSANTGTLLSRRAINITKTGVQTLTIDYTITLS